MAYQFGTRDAEHAVRGEFALDLVLVGALWQDVAPRKLPRHESVLVLLLFVFALDHDGVVHGLDRDLLGLELLHVQVDLEFVLVVDDVGDAALLARQQPPRPAVAGARRHHGREGEHHVLVQQPHAEILVENAARAHEVVEEHWNQRHFPA